ncbi:hypothetical protein EXIGLDRAFT_716924 [Exidia glandulosa HHB12029]|uniref:BHLH domain-containing protein n=1 Tax=Exidia glandulosa HHB12029 TaxID=1314781 RepID=A0A165IP52_EXIGL|nr:hypothetical protein EXIGLDRAFT_716924 [Exidia glandulosa HHB12029]
MASPSAHPEPMHSQPSVAQLLAMNSAGQDHAHGPIVDNTQLMTLLRHLPGMMHQPRYPDAEHAMPNGHQVSRDSTSAERQQTPYDGHGRSGSRHADDDYQGDDFDGDGDGDGSGQDSPKTNKRKRKAEHGSDEWARQRKDNHKEVERRRRGNINEGITELGRIVPNGSGEKAKGAILSRAVQYIHHLKENEARNIEKWTLEKLLMDQAMSDLQAQLEETRNLLQEEMRRSQALEKEVEELRAGAHPS